jgi:hypothetical protein
MAISLSILVEKEHQHRLAIEGVETRDTVLVGICTVQIDAEKVSHPRRSIHLLSFKGLKG